MQIFMQINSMQRRGRGLGAREAVPGGSRSGDASLGGSGAGIPREAPSWGLARPRCPASWSPRSLLTRPGLRGRAQRHTKARAAACAAVRGQRFPCRAVAGRSGASSTFKFPSFASPEAFGPAPSFPLAPGSRSLPAAGPALPVTALPGGGGGPGLCRVPRPVSCPWTRLGLSRGSLCRLSRRFAVQRLTLPRALHMFSARKVLGGCGAVSRQPLCSHAATRSSPDLTFVPACLPPDPGEVEELQHFISRSKKLFVMTGAGVSTESGIPDYRSEGVGLYARTDRRPVQHSEFVRSAPARQRYWARNFVGWPQFSSRGPNATHWVLRDWERRGKLHWLVTQNVDALHGKAGSRRLTELHGCTHRVSCLGCGDQTSRSELQERFEALNPTWKAEALGVAPDGDVFLTDEQVRTFRVPACSKCGGILKPDVTFFGDTVSREKVDFVHQRLAESDSMLVAGSSMQVYSGYRFALAAREKRLPIAVLNIGPTRLDHFASLKLNSRCGELLPLINAH